MANPTYSYTHGSIAASDKVRLLVPDSVDFNRTPPARFSNEEITTLISMYSGDVFLAAAVACEIIAMDEAKRAISVSLPTGMSISRSSTPTFWMNRAKQIREEMRKIPWELIDSVSYNVGPLGEDWSEYIGEDEE
jgi:hypothetical protein